MAKKKTEKPQKPQKITNGSHWDGKFLPMLGTLIKMLFAFGVPTALGIFLITVETFAEAGTLIENIQKNPLVILMMLGGTALIGLGLCWGLIVFIKWDTKHTVISGYRLKFTASAWNYFWTCVKWTFLTAITFGIYALWLLIKFRKWQVKHTIIIPEEKDAPVQLAQPSSFENLIEAEPDTEYALYTYKNGMLVPSTQANETISVGGKKHNINIIEYDPDEVTPIQQ